MTQVLRSLEQITTGYTFFEKDQVLTDVQLNSVTEYFDDETRLTRVQLLGVGLICGLRPSVAGDTVRVTKGVGVTTDGDLLALAADTTYNRFKSYGADAPSYAPFHGNGSMITAYELVAEGVDDSRATALNQFGTTTGKPLGDMVAVLLMESYRQDPDLCSGTDCDNLGQHSHHTPKLLLIEPSAATRLAENILNPRGVAAQLQPVVADRAAIPAATTPAMLATSYRAACNSMHTNIRAALSNLYSTGSTLLADAFPGAVTDWTGPLDTFNGTFQTADAGIQYYYDFLKDLVETYNELRWFLFEDTTLCCPSIQAFPKHLVLGGIVPGPNQNQYRTGLYPSPLVSATVERWWYAKWLAAKLNALIHAFEIPSGPALPIRVTPSRFEDCRPEARAIPFYYRTTDSPPIHQIWNFGLARRGMGAFNYSYNAQAYGAQGGAASPLTAQIGSLPFFRIEGHLGQNVTAVTTFLENEIQARRLPIALRALFVGVDKTKLVVHAPPHATPLDQMHYLVRHAVDQQLNDVITFSDKFKSEVDRAVDAHDVTDPQNGELTTQVKTIAYEKNRAVSDKAGSAKQKLAAGDSSWIADANAAMGVAVEFRTELEDRTKARFFGPTDALMGITHAPWVQWLGTIIEAGKDQDDKKLFFDKFVTHHPGVEHFAGVVRGGTFILAYDAAGTVVADFMLPYYLEIPEPPPADPPPQLPPFVPPWLDKPVHIRNPLDRVRDDRINVLERQIQSQVDKYGVLVDVMKWMPSGSGDVVRPPSGGDVIRPPGGGEVVRPPGGDLGQPVENPVLGRYLQDIETKMASLEVLHAQVAEPGADPVALKQQIDAAEAEVATAVVKAGSYVAESGMPVAKGTDGYVAVTTVAQTVGRLTTTTAVKTVTTGLTTAATGAGSLDTRNALNNIAQMKGGLP